ncbi:glycosyltransferase family 2 protein [Saccharicrinis sp. GN24d3]|uniref:glycosyltransferase family 2 protein n=1 Tax=Saccharicrinis sp. GN24d3 TaxID=3458416 RepID=UPI0040363E9D
MIEEPLVSVLMTVYNREKYISEAIESVLNSTYNNWELIIVDDQSKDRSVEIAQSYAQKDHRIRVYINEENLGDYPNRNKAASYAKGKYLKYLDADDLLYPHGLEVFVRDIERFPSAAMAISKPDDDITPLPIMLKPHEAINEHFNIKPFLDDSPLGVMIKRSVFEELNGFSGKRHVGDAELWIKVAANYNIVKTVRGLTFWRNHTEQESKKKDQTSIRYQLALDSINSASALLPNKDSILLKINKKYARYFFHLLKKAQFKNALSYKREIGIPYIQILKYTLLV